MAIASEILQAVRDHWWVLVVRGVLGIILGVLLLVYPDRSLLVLVYLFGAYAFVDGAFALIQALRLGVHNDRWWPLLLEAIIGIGVGIVFVRYPGLSAVAIAFTISIWAIATGILELMAAFRMGTGGAPWLLGLGGVLSILVGVLFAVLPLSALVAAMLVLGIYAIVFGAAIIVLGFRLKSLAPASA